MSITVAELLSLLGLLLTGSGIFGTIIWTLWRKFSEKLEVLHAKIIIEGDDLLEFKLQASEKYATFAHIQAAENKFLRSEGRLLDALASLTTRIDKLLARVEANNGNK
tara:strand:+ start:10276 stop:10599 length:324 start_codon:yes stop_codon:yes gene_type:complete